VLQEVKNKNKPRRRYAIGFLGNGSFKGALHVLENIPEEPSKADYIRGEFLRSIYMIDE